VRVVVDLEAMSFTIDRNPDSKPAAAVQATRTPSMAVVDVRLVTSGTPRTLQA
jgi:hypothetical protein